MGTLTISLSDEVEKKLREVVKNMYDSSKGAISRVIEDALRSYFSTLHRKTVYFRAYKDDNLVAQATSLDELAEILREKKVDPRDVRIISTEPIRPVIKRGWR